jgi:hypothetical protein
MPPSLTLAPQSMPQTIGMVTIWALIMIGIAYMIFKKLK